MKKRLLSLILALVLLLSVVPAVSAEEEYQLTYERCTDAIAPYIRITGYTGTLPEKLVIPEMIEDTPVMAFTEDCFRDAPIKELVLPKTLQAVAGGFAGNQTLESVTISEGPESIYIETFANCPNLKAVEIPSTVTVIEERAFCNSGLESITLPEGLYTVFDEAFSGCDRLEKAVFPSTLDQLGERIFGEKAPSHLTVYGYMDTPICSYCLKANIPFVDLATGGMGDDIYEKVVDGVRYRVNSAGKVASIIGCDPDKLADILVLPETVDGCSVTKLNSLGLSGIRCSGLILPDTLTCIESRGITADKSGRHVFLCMPNNEVNLASEFIGLYTVSYCFLPENFSLAEGCNFINAGCVGYEKHRVYMDMYQHLVTIDGTPEENLMLTPSGVYRLDNDKEYTLIFLVDGCAVPDEINGIPVTRVAASCEIDDEHVILGENVRVVEDGAIVAWEWFNAEYIYVPACIEYLPADYFPTYSPCTLYGYGGTYAETYAKEHGLIFAAIDKTPFADVEENAWYFPYVRDVYWAGLMNGTSATTFEPNGTTTRAMVVQVLYNLAGDGQEFGQYQVFNDVKYGDWYYNAIIWAYACGISTGTTETTFSPNDPVTREQLAAFLYRFTTLCGIDCKTDGDLSKFADHNQISGYARDAISWAVGAGIINGKSPTTVDPRAYATRAEIAAMLCRLLDYIEANLPA